MSAEKTNAKPLLVIVTGISGAGRSVAIKSLEDNGFYCIDNLPVAMLESAVAFAKSSVNQAHALGMDVRDPRFIAEFSKLKKDLAKEFKVDVVFLTADEEVITTRYVSTRRKHPLLDSGGELLAAIRREKALLEPIESASDEVFDTSSWSPHQLARQMESRYSGEAPARQLNVSIISFGFKYGQLRTADTLFDVRFVDNPQFVPELKEKTGLNPLVKAYVMKDGRAQTFMDHLIKLHTFLLPQYFNEGKHYFRIGIGCTGGKHRSVCFAEELAHRLTELDLPNVVLSVTHRDLDEFNRLALK